MERPALEHFFFFNLKFRDKAFSESDVANIRSIYWIWKWHISSCLIGICTHLAGSLKRSNYTEMFILLD